MADLNPRLPILMDHYRETFGHQRDYIKQRDRLFVCALLTTMALAFRGSYTEDSQRVLAVAIDKLLGANVVIEENFLGILVWFVFFAVVARYFQANMNVERGYQYIHLVEAEMTALYGADLLAREGKQYLKDYPRFGDWMHIVYSWVFPLAILLLTAWSAYVDYERIGCTWTLAITAVIALLTLSTVVLYLYSTQFQKGAPWKKWKWP
jgi:hypothetical protein